MARNTHTLHFVYLVWGYPKSNKLLGVWRTRKQAHAQAKTLREEYYHARKIYGVTRSEAHDQYEITKERIDRERSIPEETYPDGRRKLWRLTVDNAGDILHAREHYGYRPGDSVPDSEDLPIFPRRKAYRFYWAATEKEAIELYEKDRSQAWGHVLA